MGNKHPNAELVGIWWLKGVDGLPVDQINTVIPEANDDFAANGFIQVRSTGGMQDNESFIQRSVLQITCAGYNKDSDKIPWSKIYNLAMLIKEGMEDSARLVETPAGYNNARVFYVECLQDPQRVPGDNSIGKYRMRIRIHWVEVEDE